MNILHLIGNGFDLNLEVNTSYSEFYKFYHSRKSDSEVITSLKDQIKNGIENWSDLELGLGDHTKHLKSVDEMFVIVEDIREALVEFISMQEEKLDFNQLDQNVFLDDLFKPENHLRTSDCNRVKAFKKQFAEENWHTDIFTFNYTRIIEQVLSGINPNTNTGNHEFSRGTILNGINHIHGELHHQLVLGVNSAEQIANESFRSNLDVLDALVKTRCNAELGHTIDEQLTAKILESQIICVFGSSLGETDAIWWESILKHLTESNAILLLYSVSPEKVNPRDDFKLGKVRREIRNKLKGYHKESDDSWKEVTERIFIGLNSRMFSLLRS